MEVPAPPLAGGASTAAPGRLGGPHPGPRAGGRGRLLLFGCGSPRRSHGTARPGPCRRLGRRRRAARYGTRSPRAALSGRSRGGRSEAGGSRRGDAPASAPSGRPSQPGCSVVDIVGVPLRTRIGSELEGLPAQRGCAGGSVDAAARGAVATPVPFAPSVSARARAVRWRNDPATQKGGRRGSFTLRPALLPSRSGALTPFLMSAGAAAHPKDMRRPPFPPRRRPGPQRRGRRRPPPRPDRHRHRPGPRRRGSPAGRPAGITAPPRVRPASAGSVPPDLVREADAEDGVGEVIPIRCPPSSVRPARTSAPTPGRGPARARRRDSGDQVAGLGAPRTRTGAATGPGPDSAPDPRHHGRTGEPPAADSGQTRARLAGPEARLGRDRFA